MRWQLQEAKQKFSEVLRHVEKEGAQVVTRHGDERFVIMDITEYHKLTGHAPDFKEFLLNGPRFDDVDISRSADPPREIDFEDIS